jgi:hypothetical protein
LVNIYAILKTEGDFSFTSHLDVAVSIIALFVIPSFRIRIVNKYNTITTIIILK